MLYQDIGTHAILLADLPNMENLVGQIKISSLSPCYKCYLDIGNKSVPHHSLAKVL